MQKNLERFLREEFMRNLNEGWYTTAYMATISANRGVMSKKEEHEAHGRLQAAIRR